MASVSASAYKGMSGGPLCYEEDGSIHIVGILVGGAATPLNNFFSHFKRGIIQGNLTKLKTLLKN